MSFHSFTCDPPTPSSLADARRFLDENNASLDLLDRKIETAETQLAQIVAESRNAINQLQRERVALEEKITHALAYMSPIRRLPIELLRHIFLMNFDEYPCCAWILSSVCSQWRRLSLSMPKLWSKVCYPLQCAFFRFFRGSLEVQAWVPLEPSPLISPLSLPILSRYRVPVWERNSHSHLHLVEIHLPTRRLGAPPFVHRPATS
jgi:F-box-like